MRTTLSGEPRRARPVGIVADAQSDGASADAWVFPARCLFMASMLTWHEQRGTAAAQMAPDRQRSPNRAESILARRRALFCKCGILHIE